MKYCLICGVKGPYHNKNDETICDWCYLNKTRHCQQCIRIQDEEI